MDKQQAPGRMARCVLIGCAWAVLASAGLRAQDKIELIPSDNPNGAKATTINSFDLRPNTTQSQAFYVYLKNAGDEDKKLTVKLSAGNVLLATGTVNVVAGKTERVPFAPLAPKAPQNPPQTATAGVPPANLAGGPPPGMRELKGYKEKLTLEVFDEDGKSTSLKKTVEVNVMAPAKYVEVIPTLTTAAKTNLKTLTVRLLAREAIAENDKTGKPLAEPCPVRLELSPDLIPGLIDPKTDGRRKGKLPAVAGREAVLDARNIQIQGNVESGYATVAVDGVERAFILQGSFGLPGVGNLPVTVVQEPWLWLHFKPVMRSTKNFQIGVEVANPPKEAAKVEVVLGEYKVENEKKTFLPHEKIIKDGLRDQRIFLGFGSPDSALLFQARVQGWTVTFDTTDTYGAFHVRAQLLDKDDKPLFADDKKPLEVRSKAGMVEVVEERVVFDESPPQGVAFTSPPSRIARGDTVKITAAGEDPQSGISQVFFFLGKPVDGKADEKLFKKIPAQPADKDRKTWTAEMTFPNDKGLADLSTEFVNGVGLSAFATTQVRLVEPSTPGAGAAAATIKGKVVTGPNDELGVTGAKVLLKDAEGKKKAEATTNDKGEFEFKDLPPGDYKVSASVTMYPKKGESKLIKLEKGKTETVTIPLRL